MIAVMPVFGTRPEAIKFASLIKELKSHPNDFRTIVTVTGQHRELLDQALHFFHIEPDHDFELMQEDQTSSYIVARTLLEMELVVKKERPDIILVQGDTSSSIGASLAAFYSGVKLGHVEAGLRSGDKMSPYPEEENRILIDSLSDLHFSPTLSAEENLIKEGYPKDRISVVGNTSIDVLEDLINNPGRLDEEVAEQICGNAPKVVLMTAHRHENIGKPLEEICGGVKEIALSHPNEIKIICSLHPNPRVRDTIVSYLKGVENVRLVEPLPYNQFIPFLRRSFCVLTDSGGVQEEAAFLGKPVLVLREKTERPEAITAGTAVLVGSSRQTLVKAMEDLVGNHEVYSKMSNPVNPFGNGSSASRIAERLLNLNSP